MRRNKKKYMIDGRFLASMSTGVDRYAYQILRELDLICTDIPISILVPGNAKEIPDYKNIKVIHSKKTKHWTQIVFGGYARLTRSIPVNLCNEAAVIAGRGITCLHDVCYIETKEMFPFVDEIPEEERQWFVKVYERIVKKSDIILTVSDFSKSRIVELLQVPENRIQVIGNGWQHFANVEPEADIFQMYPNLRDHDFYFTLSSANKNKNIEWVLENSRKNPQEQYVISGKNIDKKVDFSQYPNVIYTGYATDEMAKAMMVHCKAFLFPSFYEGFGIPPLEALSTGAQLVVTKTASLPEIFAETAHYIDPRNADINLDKLLQEPVESGNQVLEKYSWKHSAKQLYRILKKQINKIE